MPEADTELIVILSVARETKGLNGSTAMGMALVKELAKARRIVKACFILKVMWRVKGELSKIFF